MLRPVCFLLLCFALSFAAGCGSEGGNPGDANDPALESDAASDAAERENPAPVN